MIETITVGWNDSDFVCDGINDEVEINAALQEAATQPCGKVCLTGPHTYNISGDIWIPPDTTFLIDYTACIEGNSTACVKRV